MSTVNPYYEQIQNLIFSTQLNKLTYCITPCNALREELTQAHAVCLGIIFH